jgi:hypothetical protein
MSVTETELHEVRQGGALEAAKLDRERRVIADTVLITERSANGPTGGRRYSERALRQIATMAEGAPAYANHVRDKSDAFKPRDVRELIGRHRNVRYDASGKRVLSDLHLVEHHAPWVLALATEMPDVVGNSLVSRGMVRLEGSTEVVDEVVSLRSIDLVSDPASTKGLFEHREAFEASQGDRHARLAAVLTGRAPFAALPANGPRRLSEAVTGERRPVGVPEGACARLMEAVSGEKPRTIPEDAHRRLAAALGQGRRA